MKRVFGAGLVALVAAATGIVNMSAAGAVSVKPTCNVFAIDASGNPTGNALIEGVELDPLNLPDLGNGTVEPGETFPVHANSVSTTLPSSADTDLVGTVQVLEVKNIKLSFKITGAAAVSSATLTGGNVLGATATTTNTSLVLTLPGSKSGSLLPGGNAYFQGGSAMNTPAIDLNVTAPSTPGTIKTELTSLTLLAKTSILDVALQCSVPANVVGQVNVVFPGAPVAVDDTATTEVGAPVTIDVLANDEPSAAGEDPLPETLEIITPPTNGTAEVTDDYKVLYTPNAGFEGTDTFVYQVCAPAPQVVDQQPVEGEETEGEEGEIEVVCDPATVTVTVGSEDTGSQATPPDTDGTDDDGTAVEEQAELPRTGKSSLPLGMAGLAAIALGAVALRVSRRFAH